MTVRYVYVCDYCGKEVASDNGHHWPELSIWNSLRRRKDGVTTTPVEEIDISGEFCCLDHLVAWLVEKRYST